MWVGWGDVVRGSRDPQRNDTRAVPVAVGERANGGGGHGRGEEESQFPGDIRVSMSCVADSGPIKIRHEVAMDKSWECSRFAVASRFSSACLRSVLSSFFPHCGSKNSSKSP